MELQELGKTGYVNLITRPVKRSDFDMAYMVIAATNDWKLNDEIYRVCKEEGIYVNVADDKSKCDFYHSNIYYYLTGIQINILTDHIGSSY